MILTIVDWIIILFSFGSGISKIIGIKIERQGADKLGINYKFIKVMGALQLLSIPFVYLNYYMGGVVLLGLPYACIALISFKHKDHVLSIFSFIIFGITVLRWLTSL